MNYSTDWLLSRFVTQMPPKAAVGLRNQGQAQRAAVLLPLLEGPKGLELVLTKRAAHLKHHPGQISFPGGRIEAGESSKAAALREAEEEVGLNPDDVTILGQLPPQATSTGFVIEPWLSLVHAPPRWQLQLDEVADIYHAPLQELWQTERWQAWDWQYRGKRHPVYFLHWQQQLIWGATAAILHRLRQQLGSPVSSTHPL
ncbi:CoA pyrophosphatase [Alkalimonas delamerensis]|uniref:CoA pyrophosphatase n=1 Tax=Alkalimonas delamerensis TaxID=265981 RepID=A0ABT9GRW9_9GAMM|nr:CoA pyrophosphatase [Alkalimonas delamerensis]MDP4529406.1 CoA pyrophosphatase [Alkalimonas delamerensis]